MDRRSFLATSATVALLPFSSGRAAAQTSTGTGDAALNALFARIFQDQLRRSPGFATSLGLDKGANADLRAKLDTRPYPAARAQDLRQTRRHLAQLQAVNPTTLSEPARLNREIVLYDLERNTVAPARFDLDALQQPYLITQQDGAYFNIPDFLNSTHPIDTAADAEAYLSRLRQFATVLDNELAEQKRQAARGYLAPGWSLDMALGQMRTLREQSPAESTMTKSLADRAREKGIAGDWSARAARIVEAEVYPALDRQIAGVSALRPTTRPGDGVQRVPRGDELYAAALAEATTTTMTPEEVHQLGLSQVAQYSAQLDPLLRQAGFTQGSVGQRLTALNGSPQQLYPNTDAGRAQLLEDLNTSYRAMQAKLPQAFATIPTQPLEIRRVPPEIQDGAPGGYYYPATLDGSRPAIYWINLKQTADRPKYSLPALTYHEGVPGHHLQISLTQESDEIPLLRKVSFYNSYVEGWALYSEQLAEELGGYQGLERAGYLQSFLFRAARLVVDTGLHAKGWSREQAVNYMVGATGLAPTRAQREIDRYCVSPGQACSYKIGHLAWERARAEARRTLGSRFDIKHFHEVLKEGAMPLTILERRIRERSQAALSGGVVPERG